MATQFKVKLDQHVAEGIPSHVPPELVRDLDWALGLCPVDFAEPYRETERLFGPDVPPVLWTPNCIAGKEGVGAWVVTRYEDIARVYQDASIFSSRGVASFQELVGETWPTIPLGLDPPEHMKYRMVLNPFFSPKATDAMEASIREGANTLIDGFVDKGEVDFAWEFARVFPVRVFFSLMGFPAHMFNQFLDWEYDILHSSDFEVMRKSVADIIGYLREFIAEQKANPCEQLAGKVVQAKIDGQPIADDDIMGIYFMLWLGGLDTIASTLSMMFRRLGMDQALQQTLRDNPDLIPTAVEEFLRIQPLVNSQRQLTQDYDMHGVQMKKGDWVLCMVTAGNFDPQEFDDPREVRLDREPNRHFTLAGGAHRCLGSHLARRELRIALSECLRRLPPFRIKPGSDITVYPGLQSARHVHLEW